jgi:REP element-mobilizing transposase RayT
MGRPLRFIPPDSVVEVTTRTIQGRLLLRPSTQLNELIVGILGRGQELSGVQIHAVVAMSNHMHLLLTVKDASQLARFMAFVNGNIAREAGRLHGWRERFWSRRYRAIVVGDAAAQVDRLRYILANGCKEGLVDRPSDWPGVSSAGALSRGEPLVGLWFDRTAEHKVRRRGEVADPRSFATSYRIHLIPLPCWSNLDPASYRKACTDLVSQVEAETRVARVLSDRRGSGREYVLAQRPHEMPSHVERSPAPLVHTTSRAVRDLFRQAYCSFVDSYRIAASLLKAGCRDVTFPVAAFPPPLPFIPVPMNK